MRYTIPHHEKMKAHGKVSYIINLDEEVIKRPFDKTMDIVQLYKKKECCMLLTKYYVDHCKSNG